MIVVPSKKLGLWQPQKVIEKNDEGLGLSECPPSDQVPYQLVCSIVAEHAGFYQNLC